MFRAARGNGSRRWHLESFSAGRLESCGLRRRMGNWHGSPAHGDHEAIDGTRARERSRVSCRRSDRGVRMAARRERRTLCRSVLACVAVVVLVTLAGGGGAWARTGSPSSTATGRRPSKPVGVGVTPTQIKVGIALVDFDCVKNFVDEIRVNQDQVYQAYVDDINAKGGSRAARSCPCTTATAR